MASNSNISHAEMWDDSLLVDSWNEALEEYKHYHSIHARGEKVKDVLKAVEQQSNGLGGQMDYEEGQADENLLNDLHAKKVLPEETVDQAISSQRNESPVQDKLSGPGQASDGMPPRGPALPQNLIGQVHDEGLKNLLMAWYYAGYYTGLYEGQQQGAVAKHAKHAKHEA